MARGGSLTTFSRARHWCQNIRLRDACNPGCRHGMRGVERPFIKTYPLVIAEKHAPIWNMSCPSSRWLNSTTWRMSRTALLQQHSSSRSTRACTPDSLLKVMQCQLQPSTELLYSYVMRGIRREWRKHLKKLASCKLAEPSSSLLASFLFLANCCQTRRSTLAPLCFTRVLSASNYRFLLAFPSCSCQLSMSIYGFRSSSFLTCTSFMFLPVSLRTYPSPRCLACSCLCRVLHHQAARVAESVFDDLHQHYPLRLSDGDFLPICMRRRMMHPSVTAPAPKLFKVSALLSKTSRAHSDTADPPSPPSHSDCFPSVSHRYQCLHIILVDETPETFDQLVHMFCTLVLATFIFCKGFVAVNETGCQRHDGEEGFGLSRWRREGSVQKLLRWAPIHVPATRSRCLSSSQLRDHTCCKNHLQPSVDTLCAGSSGPCATTEWETLTQVTTECDCGLPIHSSCKVQHVPRNVCEFSTKF